MSNKNQKAVEIQGNLQKYCKKGAKMDVRIINKVKVSHDVYVYTCKLPDANLPLGLIATQHIQIHALIKTEKKPKGEMVTRIFTPVSPPEQLGTFDLQFKVYRKNSHPNPKFKNGGVMTQYLESLGVGDTLQITGPAALFWYAGPGHLQLLNVAHINVEHISMICGGTGINVMYPVIRAILNNPNDPTHATLIYSNKTEDDILFKAELEEAAKDHRIKIYHTLSKPPRGWNGFTGHVTKEMIQKIMPPPSKDNFMWVCGPEPMDETVAGLLSSLKYDKARTVIASSLFGYLRIMMRSIFCCTYN